MTSDREPAWRVWLIVALFFLGCAVFITMVPPVLGWAVMKVGTYVSPFLDWWWKYWLVQ